MEPREIYQSLKEKIIWLDLKPESVLNLSELADHFSVSRTPIKESLLSLEAEGWVLRHGSHFLVTPLSINRVKEISEIRHALEIQANLWAMHRITPDELVSLDELENEILSLDDAVSNRRMIELDLEIHRTIYEATKNRQLVRLLEWLLGHYQRFWLSMPRVFEKEAFFEDTLEVIRALREKDEIRLRSSSESHIKSSIDGIMGTF